MTSKREVIILLDTNFLLIQGRFKIDIFSEIDRIFDGVAIPAVTRAILQEIEILKSRSTQNFLKCLNIASGLAHKCLVLEETREGNETIDEHIIRVSTKNKYMVATTDIDLRKILRTKGITVVYLRQKSTLGINGMKPF